MSETMTAPASPVVAGATQGMPAPAPGMAPGTPAMTLGKVAQKIAQEAGAFIQQLKSLPTTDQAGLAAAEKQIQEGFIALLRAASGKTAPPSPTPSAAPPGVA